ncbi:unnamed protein product [Callosobruchus maculatus]|uniref:BED-type domain-containing protein n=1 Tax=Callosobruchus maculatus TaxID=64391 RepID=A0A653DL28_CALMS|nr:unnamed protein product [Callosobruchus maculatus]
MSNRALHATAKCTICSAILKTKDSSTKGLLAHLDRIHHIDLKAIRKMNLLSKWNPELKFGVLFYEGWAFWLCKMWKLIQEESSLFQTS